MPRFTECCNDTDIVEDDGLDFICTNCGTFHAKPIKETDEYLELQSKYNELKNKFDSLEAPQTIGGMFRK